jgi:hypothetical protein
MRTILPLGALLAFSIIGCSSSANLLTGPGEIDVKASMDPVGLDPRPQSYSVLQGSLKS